MSLFVHNYINKTKKTHQRTPSFMNKRVMTFSEIKLTADCLGSVSVLKIKKETIISVWI